MCAWSSARFAKPPTVAPRANARREVGREIECAHEGRSSRDTSCSCGNRRSTLPPCPLYVNADQTRVRQILSNLLSNGGTVEALSPGVGRGSEFIVTLPVLAEQPTVSAQTA
jgi:C4-dicarboxylate-specific signal transduction histidine kinase